MDQFDITTKITEFSDYIGLHNFCTAYHYYFLGRELNSIIHEQNYGHSHDINFYELFSKLSKSKLIGKNKNSSMYEYINDLDGSENLNQEESRSYIFAFTPFSETKENEYFLFLVMHLKSEAENIYNLFKEKEYILKNVFENIYRDLFANDDLFQILDIFTEMMEKRDSYMPYHMTNVSDIARRIGIKIGLDTNDLELVSIASSVHDVGKVFISDTIINKAGALTNEEYDAVRKHTEYSAELVSVAFSNIYKYKQIPDIISKHHENYDGSGYPYKLKGESIPLLSRIIRIADSVDAMASSRSYKNKSSLNEIIKDLEKFKGTYYDPGIIPYAIEAINEIEKTKFNLERDQEVIFTNAAISIKDYDNNRIDSYSGTFQFKNDKGRFKTRLFSNNHETIIRSNNHKVSIIFMRNGELIEFNSKVSGFSKGELFLKDIIVRPIDKLFSMSWNSQCTIRKNKAQDYIFRIIELGASGIVLEANDKKVFDSYLVSLDEVLEIKINEIVDTLHLDLKVNVKVQNVYFINNKMQIMCSYLDLKPQDTDMILKVLFRKQSELRRISV